MSSSEGFGGEVVAADAEAEEAFMRSMVRRMVSWKATSSVAGCEDGGEADAVAVVVEEEEGGCFGADVDVADGGICCDDDGCA